MSGANGEGAARQTQRHGQGRSLAIADYKTILELPAVTDADRQWQGYARQRIAQLTSAPLAPAGRPTNAPR
jgi:hypothetical protein